MSPFEIRANNIVTAIQAAGQRVDDFGYQDDPTIETVSRTVGMFLTWLTACEEARLGSPFHEKVIDRLPEVDHPSWEIYILPKPQSSLKNRIKSIWGARIAFTHADGEIDLIMNSRNKGYALEAEKYLPGVKIENRKMYLNNSVFHTAIRSMVHVRDILT